MKLVGVVGIKVRPDTRGFRDRADKELRRQLGGRDNAHSVPMRLDPEFDERELKRKFDEHKRHLNGHLKDLQKSVERKRLAPFKVEGEPEKEVVKPLARVRQEYLKHRKLMLSDLARLNKEQDQLRDKELRNEKRFAYRMRALARTERIKRGSKLDENGSFGRLATQLPLVLRRMMRETEDAFKDPASDFRKAIRDAVRDIRYEASRVKAAGFEDMRDTLRGLNAELDRTRGLFRLAEDLDLGDDLVSLRRQLKDVSGSYVRALDDARRFRAEYDKLDAVDKERLRVGFTVKDNAAIEAAEERVRSLRRELAAMGSADLHRFWKNHADGSREYAEALAEVERRRQQLARVQSGWQTMDSVFAKQGRDNRRVDAEAAAHFRKIREEADRTQRHIDGLTGTMKVELDGAAAVAAHLKWLSRPRSVPLHVRVSATSAVIAEGLLKSFAGMNVTKKMGDMLERALRDFDKFTVGAATVTSAVMTISNSVIAGVGALAGIGKGVVQVLQGVAMAPTILGAVATGFTVATTATLDFFKALKDGNYEGLTENARKTAEALKGTWTELSDTIKEDFWSEAGTAMSDFILKAMPTLSRGLGKTATAMGRAWNNVFKAFEHSLDVGYMDRMFDGLVETTGEVAKAAGPAMRAIMQLGARGAEHLPRLGRWMTRNAEAFERFIDKADRSGRIDQWINNSIDSMYALWDVGRGTWRVLEGMADAALKAGGPSLRNFADGMMRLGDSFKSVRGQAIMGDIFEGAFKGFGAFMDGFKDMLGALGRNSGWIRDIEHLSGKVMGQVARNLGTIFDDRTFQKGTISALDDLHLGLIRLRPASKNIAGIIGNLGRLGGAVFKGIAPTIDRVTGLVDTAIKNMVEPLVDVIPTITHGMGAIFNTLRGPVDAVSTIAGGAIKTFNGLPATIQQAVVAAGALLALRPHLQSFGGAIASRLVPSYTSLGRQADALMRVAEESGRPIGRATATWRAWKQEMQHTAHLMGSRAMIRPFRDVEVAAATADRIASGAGMRTYFYDAYQGAAKAGEGFRQVGRAAREAGAHFRQLVSSVPAMIGLGAAVDESGRRVRGFSTEVVAANKALTNPRPIQTFAAGMKQVASGAGAAALAIGKTAGQGLSRAAMGIMGALGGPWGLAIAGAAIGLSVLGQKSAEAKEKVDRLKSALDPMTGKMTSQSKAMGAAEAAAESLSAGWFTAEKSAVQLATQAGISAHQISNAYGGHVESIDKSIAALDKYVQAQKDAGNFDFLTESGEGRRYANLRKELETRKQIAQQAQREAQAQAQALGVSTGRAKTMNDAWQAFGDTVRAGNVSGQQMRATIDMMTGSKMALADSAFNFQVSLKGANEQMKSWKEKYGAGEMKRISDSLRQSGGDWGKELVKGSQSVIEAYSIVRQMSEPAYEAVAQAFNAAGGGEAGREAATRTATEYNERVRKELMKGGMSKSDADAWVKQHMPNPDNIETALSEEIFNEQFLAGVEKLGGAAEGISESMQKISDAMSEPPPDTSGWDRALSTIWESMKPGGLTKVIDGFWESLKVPGWVKTIGRTVTTALTMPFRVAGWAWKAVTGQWDSLWSEFSNIWNTAKGSLSGIGSFFSGIWDGAVAAWEWAKDKLSGVGDWFSGQWEKIKGLFSGGEGGMSNMFGGLFGEGAPSEFVLDIITNGKETLDDVVDKVKNFGDKVVNVWTYVFGGELVQDLSNAVGDLKDKTITVISNVVDGVKSWASGTWDKIRDKAVTLTSAVANSGPVQRLKGIWDGIRSKVTKLTASASGHPVVQRLKGLWDGVRTKATRLAGSASGHPVVQRLKALWDGIKSKSERVKATAIGTGAVNALKSAIEGVKSKTVEIVSKVKRVFSNQADGGILDGAGVQRFANGGFNIAKYANGGTRERHVAQIAPAGTYRLWAEQETGGEAYIPLAQSKRSRSERILSEVAHRFGGEFRKFANGSDHSRPVTTGGDHYTVNISAIPEDQADRVANDTLFALKHLRRGGGAGVYA